MNNEIKNTISKELSDEDKNKVLILGESLLKHENDKNYDLLFESLFEACKIVPEFFIGVLSRYERLIGKDNNFDLNNKIMDKILRHPLFEDKYSLFYNILSTHKLDYFIKNIDNFLEIKLYKIIIEYITDPDIKLYKSNTDLFKTILKKLNKIKANEYSKVEHTVDIDFIDYIYSHYESDFIEDNKAIFDFSVLIEKYSDGFTKYEKLFISKIEHYFSLEQYDLSVAWFNGFQAILDCNVGYECHSFGDRLLTKSQEYVEQKNYKMALELLEHALNVGGTLFKERNSDWIIDYVQHIYVFTSKIDLENELQKAFLKAEQEKIKLRSNIFQAVSHTLGNMLNIENNSLDNILLNPDSNEIKRLKLNNLIMSSIVLSIGIAFSDKSIINSKTQFFATANESNISLRDILLFCLNLNLNYLLTGSGKWQEISKLFFEGIETINDIPQITELNHAEIKNFYNFILTQEYCKRNFVFELEPLQSIFVEKNSYTFAIIFVIFNELIKNMFKYGTIRDLNLRNYNISADTENGKLTVSFGNTARNNVNFEGNTLQGLNMVEEFAKAFGYIEKSESALENSKYKKFEIKIIIDKKAENNESTVD